MSVPASRPTPTEFSLPVLLYHSITATPHDRMAVSPRLFEEHLALLRDQYCPISLGDALARLTDGATAPARAVAVTFDDGFDDNLELAAPLLARYRIPATFFVCPAHLGQSNDWNPRAFARRRHLSRDQVRALQDQGHEIGSHGLTHQYLPKLTGDELREELVASRQILAELCATDIRFFAYPFGDPDDRVLALMRGNYSLGFRTSRSANSNWRAAPYEIPRIAVGPDDANAHLLVKLGATQDRRASPAGIRAEGGAGVLATDEHTALVASIAGVCECATLVLLGEFAAELPTAIARLNRGARQLVIRDESQRPAWSDAVASGDALRAISASLACLIAADAAALEEAVGQGPCFLGIGVPAEDAAKARVAEYGRQLVERLQPRSTVTAWSPRGAADLQWVREALSGKSADCLELTPRLLLARTK